MTLFETHWEKELVINSRELKYSGNFRGDELFSTINKALEERGYIQREKRSEETVTESGRNSYVELRPYKMRTNYLALMVKIKVVLRNITETLERKNGTSKTLQQGEVSLAFDSWILTDYQYRWGMKPWAYFVKGWIHKYIYATPIEGNAKTELAADTAYFYGRVRKVLHSYGGEEQALPSEEEVKQKMEEEMKDV